MLTLDVLTDALHDHATSSLGAVRFSTRYVPAAGQGAKIFPPSYSSDNSHESPYVQESRFLDGEPVETVLLDSIAAQANAVEQALLDAVDDGRVSLPLLVLRTTVHGWPVRLTALEFPHRVSDAYLRDTYLDGEPFDRTELGRSLRRAALRDATAVYRVCPTALVYGTWDSHRGKPERSFKVPRSYTSELFGTNPQVGERVGSRLDPLGMLGGKIVPGNGSDGWTLVTVETDGQEEPVQSKSTKPSRKMDKLSNVGHGNVAPSRERGGVAIDAAYRRAVVSLAGLRRLRFPVDGDRDVARDAAGRAVLASLAVLGDRLAFGPADLSLRSGCDLVVEDDQVELVHRGHKVEATELSISRAVELFEEAVGRAEALGLRWVSEPIELAPRENLQEALEANLLDV